MGPRAALAHDAECDGALVSWGELYGWFDFGDIYEEAVRNAPRGGILVEVGVAFGRSLAFLARQAIDQKRDDLTIYGVDPWIVEDWLARDCRDKYEPFGGFFNAFVAGMRQHAPEELERVSIVRATSERAVRLFEEEPACFVFIDGDHRFEAVKRDLDVWQDGITDGGLLAGHDYVGFEGVRKAVDNAFGSNVRVRGSSWLVQL